MSEKRVACASERTLRTVAALAAALLPAGRRGKARISRAVMLRAAAAVLMLAASVAAPATASAQPPQQNSAAPYADVDAAAFYAAAVEELHAGGVFAGTGCGAGFCPDAPIDRATMAVWTVRIVDGEDPLTAVPSRFDDVAASHPHVSFIERFAELGITKGCGDGSGFCPHGTAVRAQMAVFLHRAFDLPQGPASSFSDIPADVWYASSVNALLASGITQGCGDGSGFCPDEPTSRAHMAVFLHRAANRTTATAEAPEPSWSTPQKHEEALQRLKAPRSIDPADWSPPSRGSLPPPAPRTSGDLPAATPTVLAFSDWCFFDPHDPAIEIEDCSKAMHAISFALNYNIGADEACVTDQHMQRLLRIRDAALAHNERLIDVLIDRHGWHKCSTVLYPAGTEDCRTHAAKLSAHLIEHYGMPDNWERYVSDNTCSTY